MPRSQTVPRSHDFRPARTHRRTPLTSVVHISRLLCLLVIFFFAPVGSAHAMPQLWLPTPAGEAWKVLQGYGCGSHNGWDRYSLDLINANGRTRGAPVRAAADGRIWAWTSKSGTLILDHGAGFYTMYSHMDSVVTTERDLLVTRGTVIGTVGARAAHGTPHLHFTAFTGDGPAAAHRRSTPLAFGEGYDLPEIGGCGQHGGATLVAGGQARSAISAGVSFRSEAELNHWYNADKQIAFSLPAGARGFSQAWDHDPKGDTPEFAHADAGYLQIAQAGEGLHTVKVRLWDDSGQPAVATYGPIGYDVTPPQPVPTHAPIVLAAGAPAAIQWSAADDNGSGVAGYRVYIGSDPNGESNWFISTPQIEAPALAVGRYLLRIQPLDYAGNAGAWATVGQIVVTG